MSLISIVLPVYNGEKFLRQSIDSIIAQTYENWELLILDDCSTDSTPDIVSEYVNEDNRIKYFRNDVNLKLPKNLNKGFSLAQGDYLTWTSDDNKYRPTALEKMHSALVSNNVDFVFASCRIINEHDEEIEYIMMHPAPKDVIVGSNCVGACFMYTRKVYQEIGNYDADLVLVEDFDYWQRVLAKFDAVTIEEILYDYRYHDGALTSTMKKDLFFQNLEKTLLKNLPSFGKLNCEQRYHLYTGLCNCRKIRPERNPYKLKCKYYTFWHFILKRVPDKIKRTVKGIIKK